MLNEENSWARRVKMNEHYWPNAAENMILEIKTGTPRGEEITGRILSNIGGLDQLQIAPAELETLKLMAEGLRTKEIARARGVALNTAITQRQRVLEKLGAKNAAHAVSIGYKRLLLD